LQKLQVDMKVQGVFARASLLANIFIEPLLTRATKVRVEILGAIRKCLLSRGLACHVKRFERSPFIVVTHDKRDRSYGFVDACKAFGSLLDSDLLRFAYATANRDFSDRLASLFLVLSDGGQPIPTFAAPPASGSSLLPASAGPSAPTVQAVPPVRQSLILQSLAPGSSCKGPAENSTEPVGSKRLPSTSRGSVPT
jgi:hypothetical protein